jgi:hypothetical protein
MDIAKQCLVKLDKRIRKIINRFAGGQSFQKIYASAKYGGVGLPCMVDEYAAYKVSHVANMLSTSEGKNILKGYLSIHEDVPDNQDLIRSLETALKHLQLKWQDWERFIEEKEKTWEFTKNEKSGLEKFKFKDLRRGQTIKGRIKNIHKCLIVHSKIPYDYENYSKFSTRALIGCLESNISNFYFRECKAPLADGMARFYLKARTGIYFTPKRKLDILNSGDGLCKCGKVGSLKHLLSCCPLGASLMTK